VIDGIGAVGAATGTDERARVVMEELHHRVHTATQRTADEPQPRVLVLEWADRPSTPGNGYPTWSSPPAESRRLTWEEIAKEPGDVVVFMPCGECSHPTAVREAERNGLGITRAIVQPPAAHTWLRSQEPQKVGDHRPLLGG